MSANHLSQNIVRLFFLTNNIYQSGHLESYQHFMDTLENNGLKINLVVPTEGEDNPLNNHWKLWFELFKLLIFSNLNKVSTLLTHEPNLDMTFWVNDIILVHLTNECIEPLENSITQTALQLEAHISLILKFGKKAQVRRKSYMAP
jgi:hypothetical protein